MSMKFFTLSCPSCGGKLEITQDTKRFVCQYCDTEHIIHQTGDSIMLEPIVEKLEKAASSFDRNASELAIKRLKEEIAELEPKRQKALAELELRRKAAMAEIERRKPTIPESEKVKRLKNELASLEQKKKLSDAKWQIKIVSQIGLRSISGISYGCLTFAFLLVAIFVVTTLTVRVIRDFTEVVTSTTINLVGRQDVFWSIFCFSNIVTLLIVTVLVFSYGRKAVKKQRLIMQEISAKQSLLNEEIAKGQMMIDQEIANDLRALEHEILNRQAEVDNAINTQRLTLEQEINEKQEQLAKHYKRVSI